MVPMQPSGKAGLEAKSLNGSCLVVVKSLQLEERSWANGNKAGSSTLIRRAAAFVTKALDIRHFILVHINFHRAGAA